LCRTWNQDLWIARCAVVELIGSGKKKDLKHYEVTRFSVRE